MLGMDAARSSYWKSYGGAPGLTFLLTTYREALVGAGVDESLLHKIFIENPSHAYAFSK
jgi:phosphotriesterase-related protein